MAGNILRMEEILHQLIEVLSHDNRMICSFSYSSQLGYLTGDFLGCRNHPQPHVPNVKSPFMEEKAKEESRGALFFYLLFASGSWALIESSLVTLLIVFATMSYPIVNKQLDPENDKFLVETNLPTPICQGLC